MFLQDFCQFPGLYIFMVLSECWSSASTCAVLVVHEINSEVALKIFVGLHTLKAFVSLLG